MNERQFRTLVMFRALAKKLAVTRLDVLPPLLAQMQTRLGQTVQRIETLESQQFAGEGAMVGKHITHLKAHIRRDQMLPLSRIARPLLKFAPGEALIWKLPHARADARTVGKQALAMAKALKPHHKLLAAAGYSKELLAAFERDATQLVEGDTRAQKGRTLRSRATREMARQFKRGSETLQVIEGLLMLHSPTTFAEEWGSLTRLGKKIGRPRKPRRRKAVPPS
jgi:hypothetical protein